MPHSCFPGIDLTFYGCQVVIDFSLVSPFPLLNCLVVDRFVESWPTCIIKRIHYVVHKVKNPPVGSLKATITFKNTFILLVV